MPKRESFNPKRRIRAIQDVTLDRRRELLVATRYVGSPAHKKNPGNYGLVPPSSPRPGATLCDGRRPISLEEASQLLRDGIARGLISVREVNGLPKNIWSVSDDGEVFEAQLDNREQGSYHGYPVPYEDDFGLTIKAEWELRHHERQHYAELGL